MIYRKNTYKVGGETSNGVDIILTSTCVVVRTMNTSNLNKSDRDQDTYSSCHVEQKHLHNNSNGRYHKQSSSRKNSFENTLYTGDARNHKYHKGILQENQTGNFSQNEDILSQEKVIQTTNTPHQGHNRKKDMFSLIVSGTDSKPTKQEPRKSITGSVEPTMEKNLNSKAAGEKERCLKNIILTPDHHSLTGNESSGVELCKRLFGITLFEYTNGKADWNYQNKDRKLVVQGVIEGSVSYTSGRIHRGDMLIRINDVDVSWINFTKSLNSLNKRKKVKLTFQSPRIVGPKSSCSVLEIPETDLCVGFSGKPFSEIQTELSRLECVALYLTLVKSSSDGDIDEEEDIIYSFPPEEQRLTALRGLFMTLSSALVDVVEEPTSSTKLYLNGSTVIVAYKQFGSDVLVFAMPENRISRTVLAALLDSFCSLLALMFSNVTRAFSCCDRNWLDKVVAFMFFEGLNLFSLSSLDKMILHVKDYNTVKMHTLSQENKLICDEILSEFESMEFDDYLDSQDLFSRRQYSVLGTSLFYKDYLLCSHVHPEQQKSLNLFMNCHGLLTLSSRQHVGHVLIWQEMKSYLSQDASVFPPGYRPVKTRCFLMIVGWNHYYLVAVVAAGSSSQPVRAQALPVSLLVKQGKSTLAQLETDEVHMSLCCEERIMNTSKIVCLASAEGLYMHSSPRARQSGLEAAGSRGVGESHKQSLTTAKPFPSSPFSRSRSVDRMGDREDSGIRRQGSKLSYGSNDSTGSGSSSGPTKGKVSRGSSVADISSIVRSYSCLQIDAPHDILPEGRIDRGRETNLFSFIHLDSAEGILISPTDAELEEVHSSLQEQIVNNFFSSCIRIRALFKQQMPNSNKNQTVFSVIPGDEDEYKEVGTLFCCTFQSASEKRRQFTVQYWVVGRRWSSPRSHEMYVCFHESAPQSVIEMAFSLGFGI